MMLPSGDYVVETAISADQAVQKLQAADFDAIVVDIRMPGFDGRSLYRFLAVYLPDYTDKVLFPDGRPERENRSASCRNPAARTCSNQLI